MRALPLGLLFFAACKSSATDATPPPGDGGAEAGAGSPCAVTRAYVERCKGELNCGASGFDAWCAANDGAVNSDAYRRGEAKCLPTVACDAAARRRCELESYASETPTPAQRALVDAYCRTCEPADVAGCTTRSTTFDPSSSPDEVSDIFIAAWELSDPLCDKIRETCTGAALDAGTTSCAKEFASCSAGPYLDAVPDCK